MFSATGTVGQHAAAGGRDFGQLAPIAGKDPKEQLWAQVDRSPGGTMIIDNSDGLLEFYDLAGNPVYVGQSRVTVPLSIFPTYVACDRGVAAAVARIKEARIDGKRPVEILPHDFTSRLDREGAALSVTVHNCLNRTVTGQLHAEPPQEIRLASREAAVTLEAGERKTVVLPISQSSPNDANAYPFKFAYRSDAGNADYAETLNMAIAPKESKRIDGNLDDWHDLEPTTDKVPYGFHAVPDTDYEYALYLCQGGKSELWRLLAPGVPRRHDFPRAPRGERTTGPMLDAKHVVTLRGNEYTYEMAILRSELAQLKFEPGTTFGLMLRAGNGQGPHVDYGLDKAATKLNGLTLHPYWERSTNCAVQWTLVE